MSLHKSFFSSRLKLQRDERNFFYFFITFLFTALCGYHTLLMGHIQSGILSGFLLVSLGASSQNFLKSNLLSASARKLFFEVM